MTALTDLLLAIVAGLLGAPLLAVGGLGASVWGLVLLTTAVAALAGAAFHATRYRVRTEISDRLWRWTQTLSLAVSAALMVAAALLLPSGTLRIGLMVLAVMKALVAFLVSRRRAGFAVVAIDSGVSLLVLAACATWGLVVGWVGVGGWWIVGGVFVSLLGAAVQLRGLRADRTFDHNDLFHLAQTVAVVPFFLAARSG